MEACIRSQLVTDPVSERVPTTANFTYSENDSQQLGQACFYSASLVVPGASLWARVKIRHSSMDSAKSFAAGSTARSAYTYSYDVLADQATCGRAYKSKVRITVGSTRTSVGIYIQIDK